MSETNEVVKRKPRKGDFQPGHAKIPGSGGFQPGHPKIAGRKKNTAAAARRLVAEKGIDPLDYLISLLTVDVVKEIEIDADGNERWVKRPVTHATKIDVAKTIVNYVYPRLTAKEISGPDGAPIERVNVDVDMAKLLSTPEGVEAAQRMALLLCQSDPTPAPAIETEAEATPVDATVERDFTDYLRTDQNGHWAK